MAYDTRRAYGAGSGAAGTQAAAFDAGLRAYMLGIYNYMASALLLTGIVAVAVANTPAVYEAIMGTGLRWVAILAPLGFVIALSAGINRFSRGTVQVLYWLYAASVGVSLSTIFMVYTGSSIARTFFVTAAAFGALSLYGYTTRRSLSGWGSFLFMGLIGIILASVVNMFLGSTMLQFVVSVAGVLIFAGLTAYDTQQLKQMYAANMDGETAGKLKVMGALRLYLDFLNMFMLLLQFMGGQRN
ncbi:Bax inhibitor-1/YccA family protein [Tistrella bauzanensis]|jgi:FtsH-binding integral membrane protein|uniref:Bax inhibitor-1/YccA family protein n=1 Tax=Tistrella arctica TaxID=3133430 RepID=A0ABU9YJI2_9PROT